MKPRILVVEDEASISEPLAENLAREGFEPEVASTLECALAASGGSSPTPAGTSSLSVGPSTSPSPGDGDDFSGPCDEAEHANDPECQSGFADDDNSGPGGGDGDNSGPGGGDDHDDD